MCLSPVAGAAAIGGMTLPAAAEPLCLALAAGVLAQAARLSQGAARRMPRRLLAGRAAAAMPAALLAAAVLTAVAVRVVG